MTQGLLSIYLISILMSGRAGACLAGFSGSWIGLLLCVVYETGGGSVDKQGGKELKLDVSRVGMTVAQAAEEFLERDFSPNTLRNFRSDLARFCEAFGGRPVETLEPAEIKAYLGGLKGRGRGKASPATHNRHYATLHNLFEWLVRQDELEKNPVAKLERRREKERLPQPMAREQIDTLFSRTEDLRDRALFSLLHRSGLRVDEALSLDIDDVNLSEGTIRVLGKGGRERVGYLSEETKPLLRRYIRTKATPRPGPLFESRQGRLSYAMARLRFGQYAEGMTRPDGRPLGIHQLRHSFGSERAGKMDALVLRDLMGHRSIRTTLRYSRVSPERTKEAFRQFDRDASSLPRRRRLRKKGGR